MTREQILENRRKVCKYLMEPERKKFVGSLENPSNSEERCCLGHMCYVMGVSRSLRKNTVYYDEFSGLAPRSLIKLVGLYSKSGIFIGSSGDYKGSLTEWNDNEDLNKSPQEIGKFLLDNIEGGEGTPWIHLSEYPEEIIKEKETKGFFVKIMEYFKKKVK